MDATIHPWWESEFAGCLFVDERLGQRLRKLIERMAGAIGASLPLACQDWANTKAAYRFFSNDRVSEAHILLAVAAKPTWRPRLRLGPMTQLNTPEPARAG